MWPRLLSALAVFIIGLSTATSSTDRQNSPLAVTADQAARPRAHQQAACRSCHWQAVPAGSTDSTGASDVNRCQSCHLDATTTPGSLSGTFHGQTDKTCTQCHSFHETAKLVVGDRQFALPSENAARFQCQACHTTAGSLTNLSEPHRKAAVDFYHADNGMRPDGSPSQSCLTCHAGGTHAASRFTGSRQAIAINTFASHPNECEITSSQNRSFKNPIDSRIPLFEDKIQCQSCHSLTSGIRNSLVEFSTPYGLCLGCHDQSAPTLAFQP